EPLIPVPFASDASTDGRSAATIGDPAAWYGRPDGAPYVRVVDPPTSLDSATADRVVAELSTVERGLIVCGPQDDPALAPAVARLGEALGWPVLADPLSGARRGQVVDAYDALL